MDRIPLEVYHLIVRQIYNDPTLSQPRDDTAICFPTLNDDDDADSEAASFPNITESPESFEALKSLRLCSKSLACMTAEFLFEKIYVHFTEESYGQMEAISRHPTYRHYVRRLCIIPKAIRGSLLQKDDFEAWLRGERDLIENEFIMFSRVFDDYAPQILTIPSSIKLTQAVIDFNYGQYWSLYTKQDRLAPKVEAILQSAIGCFTRLTRVECVRKWHRWNRFCPFHVKCRNGEEADTDELVLDKHWKVGARPRSLDIDQSRTILRAVARGRHVSGSQFDAGPLFGEVDTMAMDFGDSHERCEIHGLMAEAKDLIVRFRSNDIREVQRLVPSGLVANFLGLATDAVSLTCDFNGIFREFELIPLACFFGNVTWSHLISLSLLCFRSVESRDLIELLSRHTSNLQQLTLIDGWLLGGSWHEVFSALRGTVLKKIAVRRLGDMSYRRLSSDDRRALWRGTVHDTWLPLTHPLSQYLFDGATWSPNIPAALRQQHVFLQCDDV